MPKIHPSIFCAVVLGAGVAIGLNAPSLAQGMAQEGLRPMSQPGRAHPPRLDGPALDDMTQMLGLSVQQQQKIKAILDASQQQINNALTPDQRATLQQFQAHHGPPRDDQALMFRATNSARAIPPVQARPLAQITHDGSVARVPVEFSGGHETDPRDGGRPVILVAGALGVPAEVFRAAFTHVHPATGGNQPEPEQVRANKSALLFALGRYGVTNDRLDEVSNQYRYVRSRGESWPSEPAVAYALVKNGKITGYEIASGGSGYSSPPTLTVPGVAASPAQVQLAFGPAFESNGSVAKIMLQYTPDKNVLP